MESIELLERLRVFLEIIMILVILKLLIKLIYKNYKTKSIFQKNEKLQVTLNFLDEISREDTSGQFVSILEKAALEDLEKFKHKLVYFYKRKFFGETITIKAIGKYLFFIDYSIENKEKREIIIESLKLAALKSPQEIVVLHLIENIKSKATKSAYDTFDKNSKNFILNAITKSPQKELFLKIFNEKIAIMLDSDFFTKSQKAIIGIEVLIIENTLKQKQREAE
jgi:ribonuclease BN (tRNA processing enzyme)